MKKLIATFTMFCSILSLSAQQYGNEWIDYSKTHYKFKIGSDGIYRISYATLKNVGFPVDNVNPQHIAVYLNGAEVPIYVKGESDGSFDALDFIELVGRANDGQLDSGLYRSSSEHTNPYHSLYNDSSVYFIVDLNTPSSKHIKDYSNSNFLGKSPDEYFGYTAVLKFDDDHFTGIPNGTSQEQSFSEYTNGEGFLSPRDNRFKGFQIATPNVYTQPHEASIDVSAFSRNNPSEIVNGYNHSFGIAVGNENNLIKQSLHNGYYHIQFNDVRIQSAELDSVTQLFMGETDVVNRPLSYHTVAYVRLNYRRNFDLGGTDSLTFTSQVGNDYYRFTRYGKENPLIYDLTNKDRIVPKLTGQTIEFNTSASNAKQMVLYDLSNVHQITELSEIVFSSKNTSNLDYLIVSSEKLKTSSQSYADYRSSAPGGNFTVGLFFSEKLYDEYFYGYHHPLAIRNFIKSVEKNSPILKYILLLGKGQEYQTIRYNRKNRDAFDLVPAIGLPASDYLYVSDLSAKSLAITTPIGRIPAKSDQEVVNYLDKLKEHESLDPAPWMKHIVQIAGGKNNNENTRFKGYLDSYYAIAKDSLLGAKRSIFSKQEANTVDNSLVEEIQNSINSGANFVNYFGHGSAQVIEVDFGEASALNNKGKYPLFIFNGCALGNTFVQTSKAEDYLLIGEKGCLGWIAGTGYGFISPLVNYSKILYLELLQANYGKSVGSSIKKTISTYQDPSDALNVINARQLLFQGDPALKIHSPKNSDPTISKAWVSTNFSAISDIELPFVLENHGKTSIDSVYIELSASDGARSESIISGYYPIPRNIDTIILQFEKSTFFTGVINFKLTIDPFDSISELSPYGESNNQYSFDHLFELKKPLIIYPLPNSIVGKSSAQTIVQISNPLRESVTLTYEIDTTPKFNSNLKVIETINTNNSIVEHSIQLPPVERKDYYLRVKSMKSSEESVWSNVPFAYLFQDSSGWSEGDKYNLRNAWTQFLNLDTSIGVFEFTRRPGNNYSILTNGRYPTSGFNWNWISIGAVNIVYNYQPNGVHIMAFNPNTEKRWNIPSQYNQRYPANPYWQANPPENQKEYYRTGEYTGVYLFPTAQKEGRDSLLQLLRDLPDGYHIAMHNNRVTGIEDWEQKIFDELAKFGITGMGVVKAGEPFALFGTKGDPSQSKEKYGDYSDTINPPINQNYEMTFDIFPKSSSGTLKSEKIGPATSWSNVLFSFTGYDSESDSIHLFIYGINEKGNEYILMQGVDSIYDISAIDAETYPYLRLAIYTEDPENFTPINIARWTVHYTGVPEIAVDIEIEDKIVSDSIDRGQPMSFSTALRNLSHLSFDSSITEIKLISENGIVTVIDTINTDSILGSNYKIITDTFDTQDLGGNYQLFVTANVDKRNVESEYKNNLYFRRFHVRTDSKNPLLDVTFDGLHILNNDIVSANTEIVVSAKDDNEFLFLDRPNIFDVYLKYPGKPKFDTITIDSSFVRFEPQTSAHTSARLIISSQNLPDGTYTLSANVRDRTNNGDKITPYIINFVVVNAQTVTNVYPYPNPFTSCAKFVFTCTGSMAPEQIQINIYTISGRRVKTISKEELGPIRIGNNVTDYCWDGTDEFGDRLANGVYLYKVDMYSNGERIEQRETSADHLFNNGFGKLYIAR